MSVVLAVGAVLFAGLSAYVYGQIVRARVRARLSSGVRAPRAHSADEVFASAVYPVRHPWVGAVAALLAGGVLWTAFAVPPSVATALGLLVGVMAQLGEEAVAGARSSTIESQLSEVIDLLSAALRAGASVLAAFEATLRDARPPIRPYLQQFVGRVRLGEDPRLVVMSLADQVPLETFRLFTTALAVHWDVGGSLASTLATVGRTIRDRIELDRRVRAQGVEAHASVAAVLLITYLLAYLMWRASPERVEAFVRTGVGTALTAVAITLQAVGLVWMSRLSRSGF